MITEMLEIGSDGAGGEGGRREKEEDRRKIAALHANEEEEAEEGRGRPRANSTEFNSCHAATTDNNNQVGVKQTPSALCTGCRLVVKPSLSVHLS